MIGELLLLGAVGAGTAYAVDPQFRNSVNSAISGITGASSTSTQQSVSTNTSNTGAGWQQIMDAISQLFQNQQTLYNMQNSGSSGVIQPPPINITYPSNSSGNTQPSSTLLPANTTPYEAVSSALSQVLQNPSLITSQPLSTQLAFQSAASSTYNTITGQPTSIAQIPASSNPLLSSSAASNNQAMINSNNALNSAEAGNTSYASIIAARNLINAERSANLLPA